MTNYVSIRYRIDDGIARIELNRPDVRNALNPEMLAELLDALTRVRTDEQARVLVLTGAGERAFCAGGDLGTLKGRQADGHAPVEQGGPGRLFDAFAALGKPVIGRLNGHAIAGGLGLACACDIVVAADDVKLGTPEVNVGLFPMVIMALISRSVGPKQALKLYFTGEPVTAAEAARMGLITEAVPRAELDARVEHMARAIAGKSPAVLRLGRDAYYAQRDMDYPAQLAYLTERLAAVAATEDSNEGVRAFAENRTPVWVGR